MFQHLLQARTRNPAKPIRHLARHNFWTLTVFSVVIIAQGTIKDTLLHFTSEGVADKGSLVLGNQDFEFRVC